MKDAKITERMTNPRITLREACALYIAAGERAEEKEACGVDAQEAWEEAEAAYRVYCASDRAIDAAKEE